MDNKENRTHYGVVSSGNLARIRKRGFTQSEAQEYDHNDYCLPFLLRLCMKLEDLDLLQGDCPEEAELGSYLLRLAAKRGISLRADWFSGENDPGEYRDNDSTRMNIYGLCAALDADYQDTCEIFQKVFFKCAFLPKRKNELVFYYYARKAEAEGEPGSAWYERGLELMNRLPRQTDPITAEPIRFTRKIYSSIEGLSEAEFERFLMNNPGSFTDQNPLNEFVSAKTVMKELAEECWQLLRTEFPEENGMWSETIQYDRLIDGILGFRQRAGAGSVGLSDLKLPRQLLSCFPSGKILGDILGRSGESLQAGKADANAVISLDELYKMMILLLFYYYFSQCETEDHEQRFQGFVTIVNDNLGAVGLDYIYPGQPYGSFILYHAAAQDPIESLRSYLQDALEKANREKLSAHLQRCCPALSGEQALTLTEACDDTPFFVRLYACLLREGLTDERKLLTARRKKDAEVAMLNLCEALPPAEIRQLGLLSLVPKVGITKTAFSALFPTIAATRWESLRESGVMNEKKGIVQPDPELGRFMRQVIWQYDALRSELVGRAETLAEDAETVQRDGTSLAAVLAALAPKLAFDRRADTLLRASGLYAGQKEDKKLVKRAYDCAAQALEQKKRYLNKRERSGETEAHYGLNVYYQTLLELATALGIQKEERQYRMLLEGSR